MRPLRLAGVRASSSRFTSGLGVNGGAERGDEEPEPDDEDAVILGA